MRELTDLPLRVSVITTIISVKRFRFFRLPISDMWVLFIPYIYYVDKYIHIYIV